VFTLFVSFILLFISLYTYAIFLDATVATAVFLGLLFGWLALVLANFALIRIQIEDAGMIMRSRFLKKDFTPWSQLRIRHAFGPFFLIGDPPTRLMGLLGLLVLARPRAFGEALRARNAPQVNSE
jgi:hypothetical protein